VNSLVHVYTRRVAKQPSAFLLAIPAVVPLRGRWGLLRQGAGRVMIFGLVAMAGGQLFYFNAIESIPIGWAPAAGS
jgi:hypothetical protein